MSRAPLSRLVVPTLAAALALPVLGATPPADLVRRSAEHAALAHLPPGFPRPPIPADNPLTPARVELGRHLFYERRLSADGTFSCASCHRQERAFTDGRGRARGVTGELHPRGAMSLANVAYNATLGWDDPGLDRLEDQALIPLLNREPVEMGLAGREAEVLARLAADPDYQRRFAAAFPGDPAPVTLDNVARALAGFERTLFSGGSPYDRFVFAGDGNALSPAAWRGLELFFSDRLGCGNCHGGFNLSGPTATAGAEPPAQQFHNTGLYNLAGGAYPPQNPGLVRFTGEPADRGRFRAPTLRNVTLTAPYMHDGSIATLDEVIDHYAAGGRTLAEGPWAGDGAANPYKSDRVTGFALNPEERADLLAFLGSLTDPGFVTDPRYGDPAADPLLQLSGNP